MPVARTLRAAHPEGGALLQAAPPGYPAARNEGCFAMATVTRAGLGSAVQGEVGLSQREARELVDALIEMMAERLTAGEAVTISGFGTFNLRDKRERLGRNPKTREEAPISARRVVVFRASQILKGRIAVAMQDAVDSGPDSQDGPGVGQSG